MQMTCRGKLRGTGYLKAVLCLLGMFLMSATTSASRGQAVAQQDSPQATGKSATASGKTASDKSQGSTAAGNTAASNTATGNNDGLVIEPAELPPTYPHGPYQEKFHARGNYVPVLHWRVERGTLPPGIKLDDNGLLRGEAERAGEFQFVVAVRDGGQPQQAWQKAFTIKVVEAITVAWKVPAHVNANRIEGSVDVSNTTVDDMDLTFDVKAVAENGRATEIGYQHFPLKKGTMAMTLPFGESLPYGGYVVYVNVVGEVAKRNAIYRERMQTNAPLQVLVGP
jgi:hypothetical protein